MGFECPINRVVHCVIIQKVSHVVLFRYYFVMIIRLYISGEPYSNFGLVAHMNIYLDKCVLLLVAIVN